MYAFLTSAERDAQGRRHRFEALDSLRGVCACLVVLFHFQTNGIITNLPFIAKCGWMYVDFFFVLSGFVISTSYASRLASGFEVSRYMLLRIGRVYPLHALVLFAYLVMVLASGSAAGAGHAFAAGGKSPGTFGISLLLLQVFGFTDGGIWNPPSWSIAAEVWIYLLTALIFRYAGRMLFPLVGVLIIVCILVLARTDAYLAHEFDAGALLRCFYGFGLGILAWRLYHALTDVRLSRGMATLAEIVVAAIALGVVMSANAGWMTLLAPPCFFLVVLAFAQEQGVLSRALRASFFRLLGVLSYSIYITHTLLLGRFLDALNVVGHKLSLDWVIVAPNGVKSLHAPFLVTDGMVLIFMVGLVGASWITYTYIETPMRDASRRLAKRIWDAPKKSRSATY